MTPAGLAWPVIIKPTATETGASCYECVKSMYRPDRRAMLDLVNAWAGAGGVDGARVITRAESHCDEFGINILGGTFVAFLEVSQGLTAGLAFTAFVDESRLDVVHLLYSDLRHRGSQDPRRRRIQLNNQGRFVVVWLSAATTGCMADHAMADIPEGAMDGPPDATFAAPLNSAKVRYRALVDTHVRRYASAAGDHMVHVPGNASECDLHLEALASVSSLPRRGPASGGKWDPTRSTN